MRLGPLTPRRPNRSICSSTLCRYSGEAIMSSSQKRITDARACRSPWLRMAASGPRSRRTIHWMRSRSSFKDSMHFDNSGSRLSEGMTTETSGERIQFFPPRCFHTGNTLRNLLLGSIWRNLLLMDTIYIPAKCFR